MLIVTMIQEKIQKLSFKKFTFMDEGQKIRFKIHNQGYIHVQDTGQMISYVPKKVTLHKANREFIRELGHSVISEEFQNFQLIKPEHFVFKSADGKYNLDGLLYKPAHFDPHNEYSLIMSVYGSPDPK